MELNPIYTNFFKNRTFLDKEGGTPKERLFKKRLLSNITITSSRPTSFPVYQEKGHKMVANAFVLRDDKSVVDSKEYLKNPRGQKQLNEICNRLLRLVLK